MYLIFDEGGQGEEVEEVGEVAPDIGIPVLAKTLVVEAVHLCDLAGFVIAAKDGDAIAVPEFEGD